MEGLLTTNINILSSTTPVGVTPPPGVDGITRELFPVSSQALVTLLRIVLHDIARKVRDGGAAIQPALGAFDLVTPLEAFVTMKDITWSILITGEPS